MMNEENIAKMLQKLPSSTQFAIANCLPNIPYGASWGLCDLEEVREMLPAIKADKNLFALPVRDGVVLQVAKGYLETVCNKVCYGLVTMDDLRNMNKHAAEAVKAFDTFLTKKESKGETYRGLIGIYCVNAVPNIRINDKDYPAFRVDFSTTMQILHKHGYSIVTNRANFTASDFSAITTQDPVFVAKNLIMSPTKTGVFINVTK